MPSRADLEAARPRCDRLRGPLSERSICGLAMAWYANDLQLAEGRVTGKWVCPKHGQVLDGLEAAERAGYRQTMEAAA